MNRDGRNSPAKMEDGGKVENSMSQSAVTFTIADHGGPPAGGTSAPGRNENIAPAPAPVQGPTDSEPDPFLNTTIEFFKARNLWSAEFEVLLVEKKFADLQRSLQTALFGGFDQLTMTNNQLTTTNNQRSLRALLEDKRPFRNMTASDPHVRSLNHPTAEIVRVAYDYDEDIEIPLNAAYTLRATPEVQSETDIQSAIHAVLTSISGRWEGKIMIHQNRRIIGTECDLLLTYGANRIPFSAGEIKKNGGEEFVSAIFKDSDDVHEDYKGKVQGEHFVQLTTIQLFGLLKVFGLISDGNHTMITCTSQFSKDDLPQAANQEDRTNAAPTPNKRPRTSNSLEGDEKYISPDNQIDFEVGAQVSVQEADNDKTRKIYCSDYTDVIKEGGNDNDANWSRTVKMFAHYLNLAFNSVQPHLFTRKIILNETLPAHGMKISLLEESLVYESNQFSHTSIKFTKQPDLYCCLLLNNTVKTINLFKHLGLGVNGDCCLGTTNSGKSFCAVKFFADLTHAMENAIAEQAAWNTIYDRELPKVLRVQLPPTDNDNKMWDACICMPYLVPIDGTTDRKAALEKGMIEERLQAFAAKNYHHNEAGVWRYCHLLTYAMGQTD